MATSNDVVEIQVPSLTFISPNKTLEEMTKEEFQAFVDVWLDAGSALATGFVIAQRMQNVTVDIEQVAWTKRANRLDRELTRHRRLMEELRSNQVIIQPPTEETVAQVDAITAAVGALQKKQAKAEAALSAVNAALDIASQVQAAKAPAPGAAAPAPAPTAAPTAAKKAASTT